MKGRLRARCYSGSSPCIGAVCYSKHFTMEQSMTLPKWNDPALKAGTMIRTALWLISEIGVGNSFTKGQHREAFSGVTQADRRLRDLRDYGWIIDTSAEDVTLNPEEQRFVACRLQSGLAAWSSQDYRNQHPDCQDEEDRVRREQLSVRSLR